MSELSSEGVAAARAYQALHVPALFQQWTTRVADAAAIGPGERVLDVGCGMLAVANELAPHIEWRAGVAESLPCDDASFDAVVSQFGLMFFEDRVKAIREMLRVLVPGGRLAVAVWDSLENSENYAIEVELLDRIGGKAAGDALRAPFVLGAPRL